MTGLSCAAVTGRSTACCGISLVDSWKDIFRDKTPISEAEPTESIVSPSYQERPLHVFCPTDATHCIQLANNRPLVRGEVTRIADFGGAHVVTHGCSCCWKDSSANLISKLVSNQPQREKDEGCVLWNRFVLTLRVSTNSQLLHHKFCDGKDRPIVHQNLTRLSWCDWPTLLEIRSVHWTRTKVRDF